MEGCIVEEGDWGDIISFLYGELKGWGGEKERKVSVCMLAG